MTTYTGGCHCGNVRYKFETEEITSAIQCNCSICAKRGWLLTFIPKANFHLTQGEGETTLYQFNTKRIHHLFCKTCGVASFGHGSDESGNEMVAINLRCIDDINIDALTIHPYDGKNA